jgi:hypothetical protein
MIRYSKSGSSDRASKIRCQTPFWLQRLNRRKTLFHSPNTSGRSRQGAPVRTIQSTPSINIPLLRPVEPRWSGRPMIRPEIRSHRSSFKTSRSSKPKTAPEKAVLNHASSDLRIPKSPHDLARDASPVPFWASASYPKKCLPAGASVPRFYLSAIGLDRMRQENTGASETDDGHY